MVGIISPGSRQTNGGYPGLIQVAPAGAVSETQPHFASETGIATQWDTVAICTLNNAE